MRAAAVVFEHDCNECVSLGPHFTEPCSGPYFHPPARRYYDLYVCLKYLQVFARFGDNGAERDGGSILRPEEINTPALHEAISRAALWFKLREERGEIEPISDGFYSGWYQRIERSPIGR